MEKKNLTLLRVSAVMVDHAPGSCPQFHASLIISKYSRQLKSESRRTIESSKIGSMAAIVSQPVPKNRQRGRVYINAASSSETVDCPTLLHASLWNKIEGP